MKKFGLALFFIFQIVLIQIIKSYPEFIETYYSNWMYQKISLANRFILGYFPFSIGDYLYGILILFVLFWLYKKRNTWRLLWKNHLLSVVNFLSVVYFAFHVLWGFNYYRVPLSDKLKINTEYNEDELLLFTNKMIALTNETHYLITKNKNEKVAVPHTTTEIFTLCNNGFTNLSVKFPEFRYENPSVKASLFSVPLSYMGFGGYLNPFTNEAQINTAMPSHVFGMTASHEMAHQIGFASESECNFIGYLAAVSNDDLYIKYSAQSFALRYCLSLLKAKKSTHYKTLKLQVNTGILKNFKQSDLFWKAHESFIETGFKVFYDNFLKANQQQDGLEGYGKFLNLLIGFERVENDAKTE